MVFSSIKKLTAKGIENVSFRKDKIMNFSYKDKLLMFDFFAVSYLDPTSNLYKYKLFGFDDKWIDLGRKHSITFANLTPGNYELKVIGTDFNREWDEKGVSVKFHISSPFWNTWWFILAVIGSIFFLSSSFYRSRLRRLKKEIENIESMNKFLSVRKISNREKEIILLLVKGKSGKEIEDELFISYGTVKNHIYKIYKKLDIKNRVELVNLFKDVQNL